MPIWTKIESGWLYNIHNQDVKIIAIITMHSLPKDAFTIVHQMNGIKLPFDEQQNVCYENVEHTVMRFQILY